MIQRKRTDLALSSASNYLRLGMTAVAGPAVTHFSTAGREAMPLFVYRNDRLEFQDDTQQTMEKLPSVC
jgi:hypothetical protein